jgi:DNA-3-methyladenine glycosylase
VKLPRSFYDRPTLDVARDLLGKVLVHARRGVRTSGAIVEVEAYIGEADPACHAAPGPTPRNAPMYGAPGHVYVYLNYGIHWMVNIVTESHGSPAAVLIRALDPIEGVEAMRRRRGVTAADHDLCRGPGNLTKAMAITQSENHADLLGTRLYVEDRGLQTGAIAWGPRIGINVGKEYPWRAWVSGHPAVSRAPRPRGGRRPARPPARAGAGYRRG